MAIEDLSQRTRFWLTIALVTIFLVVWTMVNPFRPKEQPKPTDPAQVAAQGKKDEAAPKKDEQAAKKEPEPVKPVAPPVDRPGELNKLLTKQATGAHHLGDDQSKIKVLLSDRGAAIRRITLNSFESSDRLTGQRMPAGADGKRPRMVLVTDDEDGDWAKQSIAKQFELLSYRLGIAGENDQCPPELAALAWTKQPNANTEQVSYSAEVPSKNLKITKTYKLANNTYHVDFEVQFAALDPAKPCEFVYELSGPQGVPVEGLRWKSSGSPFRTIVYTTHEADKPTNVYRDTQVSLNLHKAGEPTPKTALFSDPKNKRVMVYAGVMIQFFASLAVVDQVNNPDNKNFIEKVISEYVGPDPEAPSFYGTAQGRITTRLISSKITLAKDKVETHRYLLFAGPSKSLLLSYEDGVDPKLPERYGQTHHMNQLTDASFFSFTGTIGLTALLVKTTNLMHWLLEWLHAIFRNYGVAIIFMTFIVRICLLPLSRKQAQMQAKMSEKMKVLKPDMDEIKKKFPNDRQMQAAAQMELWKKHKVNPLGGCSGCLILFLQMPIFLGLYYALQESIHLRMSGFLWMDNLAMPDMLLHWGDNFFTNIHFPFLGMHFTLFYLGPYLHLLPIISITLMYAYQKIMAPPAMSAEQEAQMKMMNRMTWLFGLAFYWIPSGLCIYFILSSAWGMIERKFFIKKPGDHASLPEKENGKDNGKPGIKSKLGDLWRDLQSKADKRV